MCIDNPEQERLADLPIQNVLAIAPPGCGKTEALARRTRSALKRRDVVAPRMILALTFSNKAKANLAARMRAVVGPFWRRRVQVTNFHGLSTRLIRAHGTRIGVSPDTILPNGAWRRRELRDLGIDFAKTEAFESALRSAKSGAFSDDEVLSRLSTTGNVGALAFQERLRAQHRLDHDDLIRHAARLVRDPSVARVYQAHFAMVLVDEVQDLSRVHLDLVQGLGGDRVTYAGDPAQGIYSFAGADPVGVMARISATGPAIVELSTSYRSSPAVLGAVNAISQKLGSTRLFCGCPEKWPDGGHVIYLERGDTNEEADAVLIRIRTILARNPDATIGIVCRRGTRLKRLQAIAAKHSIDFEDWRAATHVPHVVDLLRRHVHVAANVESPATALVELERSCRSELDPADASTADELSLACDDLRDLIERGSSLPEAVGSCRVSAHADAAVAPGVHFLTAHRGKGQEFDWVFIVGMEHGQVPDFRNERNPEELRILHVMASRARYGLIFTYARRVLTKNGWRDSQPSPWLSILRAATTSVDTQDGAPVR